MTEFEYMEVILIEVSIELEDPFSDERIERDIDRVELDIKQDGTSLDTFPKDIPTYGDSSDGKYYYRWLTESESNGEGHYTLVYKAYYEDDVKIERDRIALR